jgi:D-cysteine desulfhydrase
VTAALFEAIPRARERIAWLSLGQTPTRVHRVEGVVPANVDLWIKREDESAHFYGGNKIRKLEFLLGRAADEGRKRLVTFGQFASHHVAAAAIHGRRHGFTVDAVLFPQPVDAYVRTMLLVHQAAGATLHPARNAAAVIPHWWRARERRDTAWLAGGGSCAIGSLGAVSLGLEIAMQIESGELPAPDVVYCPLGSAGTVAGLLYGLRTSHEIELVAVNAADRLGMHVPKAKRLATAVATMLDPLLSRSLRLAKTPHLRVERRFCGPLSQPTDASRHAVERVHATTVLRFEPVYTGKAMAALLDDANAGKLAGKRVLFVHTWNAVDLGPLVSRAPGPEQLPMAWRSFYARAAAAETKLDRT